MLVSWRERENTDGTIRRERERDTLIHGRERERKSGNKGMSTYELAFV